LSDFTIRNLDGAEDNLAVIKKDTAALYPLWTLLRASPKWLKDF